MPVGTNEAAHCHRHHNNQALQVITKIALSGPNAYWYFPFTNNTGITAFTKKVNFDVKKQFESNRKKTSNLTLGERLCCDLEIKMTLWWDQ